MRSGKWILIGLFVLISSQHVFAQSSPDSVATPPPSAQRAGFLFAARLGLMTSGDITIKLNSLEDDVTIESGFSGGIMLELPSSRGTSAAFTVDLHKVDPEYVSESKSMIEFGLQFKGSMRNQQKTLFLRPFVGVGFGLLPEISFLESSHFLILKGGLEMDFFGGTTGPGGMVEIGLLGSPLGKSEDFELTAEPRPFVRVGILFR